MLLYAKTFENNCINMKQMKDDQANVHQVLCLFCALMNDIHVIKPTNLS